MVSRKCTHMSRKNVESLNFITLALTKIMHIKHGGTIDSIVSQIKHKTYEETVSQVAEAQYSLYCTNNKSSQMMIGMK